MGGVGSCVGFRGGRVGTKIRGDGEEVGECIGLPPAGITVGKDRTKIGFK